MWAEERPCGVRVSKYRALIPTLAQTLQKNRITMRTIMDFLAMSVPKVSYTVQVSSTVLLATMLTSTLPDLIKDRVDQ
jgi:hypothetical protein